MKCPITGDYIFTVGSGENQKHIIEINPNAYEHQQRFFGRHQPSSSPEKDEYRPRAGARSSKRPPAPARNTGGYYSVAVT
jgi:hypothetical protein